ncbi:MAG TPA: DinB family protein [Vicinamibacterales bacterium]|nr:DinB family protein [Vicinamibacterales bacterium]
MPSERPGLSEASDYYFQYINQVPAGDIRETLRAQRETTRTLLRGIDDRVADHRYAEGKWTLREVAGHLADTERLFLMRAFWFARGFDTPLPSFDQNTAIVAGRFNTRTWGSLIDEFAAARDATIAFFDGLPAEAWDRRGVASDNPFSVRALAWLAAGHVEHHLRIVRERYVPVSA